MYTYTQRGLTALMVAVVEGHSDIVTLLLEAGANANVQEPVSAQLMRK